MSACYMDIRRLRNMSNLALGCGLVAAVALVFLASLQAWAGQMHSDSSSDRLRERPAAGDGAYVRPGQQPLGCRGSSGQLVDWWVILKLPNGTRYGWVTADDDAGAFQTSGSSGEKVAMNSDNSSEEGEEFGFGGEAGEAGGWVGSRHLNRLTSPLSRTLLPLYDPGATRSVGHVMYNDESPAGQVEFYRAHAKGVLAFGAAQSLSTSELRAGSQDGADTRKAPGTGDQAAVSWQPSGSQEAASRQPGSSRAALRRQLSGSRATRWMRDVRGSDAASGPQQVITGFWLQHSAPKFPAPPGWPPRNFSGIPHAQQLFGQHFACLTLGADAVETVARTLQTSFPFVYSRHMPPQLQPRLPQVRALMRGRHPLLPTSSVAHIRTGLAGEQITLVYKSRSLWVELYSSLVEKHFQKGMILQTWLRGAGAMPSFCPPLRSYASLNVYVLYMDAAREGWIGLNDHSKWAISSFAPASQSLHNAAFNGGVSGAASQAQAAGSRVVCLGDMNREYSQMYRGGGALCFDDNEVLWRAFSRLVIATSGCKLVNSSLLNHDIY